MNISQTKIYDYLLNRIIRGELVLKERIPTEKELGVMFNTTRMNAHRAIKKLEEFGVLCRNKKQGTFVHRIPPAITTGELKSLNTRRVCVLNHNSPRISKIHWNERIINVFEEEMRKNKIDMTFKDISHLNTIKEFCNFIIMVVEEGYNSLVIVSDYFINNIILEHPEILFQFHKNIFIFDRGSTHCYEWPYNVVSIDLFGEGIIAAEYLILKNYEKVIYIEDYEDCYWSKERERGLRFGLQRGSIGKIKADVLNRSAIEDGTLFDKLDDAGKYIIIGSNDEIAASVFQNAEKRNLKPGIDFGLLGFDNNVKFKELNLTTISPSLEKVGSRLAELVTKNINPQNKEEIITIRIYSELIIRKTC